MLVPDIQVQLLIVLIVLIVAVIFINNVIGFIGFIGRSSIFVPRSRSLRFIRRFIVRTSPVEAFAKGNRSSTGHGKLFLPTRILTDSFFTI